MKKSKFAKALLVVSMLATYNACKSVKEKKENDRLFVSSSNNDWEDANDVHDSAYVPCHNGTMYWFYVNWMMNSQGRIYPVYVAGNSDRVTSGMMADVPSSITRGGFAGDAHVGAGGE